MKQLCQGILLIVFLLGLPAISSSITPSKVIGLSAQCDRTFPECSPIPSSLAILCNGGAGNLNCPQYFSPDYGDPNGLTMYGITNVVNPPRCIKSVDRGTTWSACTANPFAATYFASNAVFAMAADGSLLAAARVTAATETCVIRRSSDGGVTWTTVLTSTTAICSGFSGDAYSSPMRCSPETQDCVLFGNDLTTVRMVVFHSEDYGQTWTEDVSIAVSLSTPPYFGASMSSDGSMAITGGSNAAGGTSQFVFKNGGAYHASTIIPGVGNQRCTGPFILQTKLSVLCGANSTSGLYTVFQITGSVPSVLATFLISDTPAFANSPETTAIQWDNTTAYFFLRQLSTGTYLIYVTRDAFTSYVKVGELVPTNKSPTYSRGDMHVWNGAVYWTSGGIGGNAQLMVIR